MIRVTKLDYLKLKIFSNITAKYATIASKCI